MSKLCFVCGKPIADTERFSVCKLIPRTVFKWATGDETNLDWFKKEMVIKFTQKDYVISRQKHNVYTAHYIFRIRKSLHNM